MCSIATTPSMYLNAIVCKPFHRFKLSIINPSNKNPALLQVAVSSQIHLASTHPLHAQHRDSNADNTDRVADVQHQPTPPMPQSQHQLVCQKYHELHHEQANHPWEEIPSSPELGSSGNPRIVSFTCETLSQCRRHLLATFFARSAWDKTGNLNGMSLRVFGNADT